MKKVLLFAAMIAVLASCKKENITPNKTDGSKTPLAISSASLAKIVTKSGTVITTGGKIGVFQTTTTDGYAAATNVEYDYNAGTSKWEVLLPANEIYLNNKDAAVCAYYPYDAAVTNATNIALTSQLFDPAKDLCFAPLTTVKNTAPTVNWTMNHAYSQLTFKIKKDASYTGVGLISAIAIKNPGTILAVNTLDITNGAYGAGTAGDVSYDPGIATMSTYDPTDATTIAATTYTNHVLMVPVTTAMATDVTLSFTIDGIVHTATVPVASLSQLVPGTNYSITVVLLGAKLVVSSVTVTDWIPADITDPVYPQP